MEKHNKSQKYAPQMRYASKTIRRYSFGLNRNTEADMIDHMDSIDNTQGYLKSLIRKDMQKAGK